MAKGIQFTTAGTPALPAAGSVRLYANAAGDMCVKDRAGGVRALAYADNAAIGDGSADDTAELQAAINTGGNVSFAAGGNYRITGPLRPVANEQTIDLNGSTITIEGGFNAFEIEGGLYGTRICNGVIEGALQTSGYVIAIDNADRTTIENLRVHSPRNFMDVRKANVTHLGNVWVNDIRGQYGIRWTGDAMNRSDILRLVGVNLSSNFTAIGILWDGNCNTLQTQSVTIVNAQVGLQILNTTSGPAPAFGMFDDLEIDNASGHAISINAGENYYFTPTLYCHGSATGSGIYVGPGVPHDRVIISGGKITNHARYGIENAVRVMAGNLVIYNNAMGDYASTTDIYQRAPRFEVDGAGGYFQSDGTTPLINWDGTDYDSFDRPSNLRQFRVADVVRMQMGDNADAVEIYVGGALKRVEVGAADSGGTGYRMLRVTN